MEFNEYILNGILLQEVNCQNELEDNPLTQKYPQLKEEFLKFSKKYDTPQKRYGMFQSITLPENSIDCNSYSKMTTKSNETLLINNIKRLNELSIKTSLVAYVPEYLGCEDNPEKWSTIRNYIETYTYIQII